MNFWLIILAWLTAVSAFCIVLVLAGHWITASIIFVLALSAVRIKT
jgi:hypothetical protein